MTNIANATQHESWNGTEGQRWVANADRTDRVFDPVASALLDAAALHNGERVLDIGCGCGPTTLSAANAVGNNGHVTGIDISDPILELVRTRATQARQDNIDFVLADAQTHQFAPASVDVAISRFGTMFFNNPVAAFTNIASALRRGGRLCIATWQPVIANQWLIVPGAALLAHAEMPSGNPNEPGMFAQSDPSIIESVLTDAGFQNINCNATEVTLNIGADVDDAIGYLASSGPGRAMLETIEQGLPMQAALADVRAALDALASVEGVFLNAGVWITTATTRR